MFNRKVEQQLICLSLFLNLERKLELLKSSFIFPEIYEELKVLLKVLIEQIMKTELLFCLLHSKTKVLVDVAGLVHSFPSPLYSLGSTVSEGVRHFVETGDTDMMELETVNTTFLDAILAPPIQTGQGDTNTTIFVDSNHTKVLQSLSDLIMM